MSSLPPGVWRVVTEAASAQVISELARKGLNGGSLDNGVPENDGFYGFQPLPKRGKAITNELIDRLREDGAEHRPSPPANLRHV